MFSQGRFHERTHGHDAQPCRSRRSECRFDQCHADLVTAQRRRHLGVNQRQRVARPFVQKKRRLAVQGELKPTVFAGSLAGNVSSSASSSFESAREVESPTLHRLHERHVDEVFGDEPDLQLVAANHVAHEQVIRAIITGFRGAPRHRASLLQHDLVGMQQT